MEAEAQPRPLRRARDATTPAVVSTTTGVVFDTPLLVKVEQWVALAKEDDEKAPVIDENALLQNDGVVVPTVTGGDSGGCATKRKACANCSCGRKEQEQSAAVVVTSDPAAGGGSAVPEPPMVYNAASSSCGNCSKGDAFRCAGCPFLGKPAFKTGAGGAVLLDAGSDF
jgi:hypothetical protein